MSNEWQLRRKSTEKKTEAQMNVWSQQCPLKTGMSGEKLLRCYSKAMMGVCFHFDLAWELLAEVETVISQLKAEIL